MGKTVRRISPFPAYDIEAMESWLTDMGKKGLFLEAGGLNWGIARFRREEPRALPHRLISAREAPTLWQGLMGLEHEGDGPPPQEVQDFHALYGWEYVGMHARFHIYRGTTEHPRELHTDPQVQADTLRWAYRWLRLGQLGLLLLALACLGYLWFDCGSLWGIVCTYPWTAPFLPLALFVCARNLFLEHRHFRSLIRRLELGQGLDHQKPWAGKARRNLSWIITSFLLAVLLMVSWFVPLLLGGSHITFGGNGENLPFATAVELFFPEGVYRPEKAPWLIEDLPSYLFPQSLHWREEGIVTWQDGRVERVFFSADYLRSTSSHGAQWQLEQLRKELSAGGEEASFPLPDMKADYKAMFLLENSTCLLVRKGNEVMSIWLSTTSPFPPEKWGQRFFDSLS